MPLRDIIMGAEGPAQTVQSPKESKNFKDLFCERFRLKAGTFEKKLFSELMNPDVKMLAVVINWVRPGFFDRDFEYIRRIAYAENKREIAMIAHRLPFDQDFNQGVLRGLFRLRISGRRLVQLANQLF